MRRRTLKLIILLSFFCVGVQDRVMAGGTQSSAAGGVAEESKTKTPSPRQQRRRTPSPAPAAPEATSQTAGSAMAVAAIVALPQRQLVASDEAVIASHGYTSQAIAKITDRLFLSSVKPAEDMALLRELGITHIVNITGHKHHSSVLRYPPKFPTVFQYLHIVTDDEMDAAMLRDFPTFEERFVRPGFDFIEHALADSNGRERVLVHCEAGISRSSTMVIAYLMHEKFISLRDAFETVKRIKNNIAPNHAFFAKLIEFEHQMSELGLITIITPGASLPSYSLEDYWVDQASNDYGVTKEVARGAYQRAN
ncbi:MAG: dual specificity protein phosphatase family protein, partial [Oligoflexia bacterium]|nr:dual specificity protein phosphatase family protein [Oligoflexia bacterium]